ncbi:TetR/AcrR family transcriptional regulator [Streptomyces sp. SCSIO ZS0520]|uniref:TetR/AcrR family transcriptional regulator n=1 Tax=Streptomyces sp. SCSIO ZS0520 TaxID=2892996 RepID=UPI0021DAF27F|nr:TetR/AcrR family transcriptional regulator [Streptomyces sp. SCSIO ZS0520]
MGRSKEFDPELAVDRAMEVFWSRGYSGTSPQHLVEALGIGRGSLYNAFGSKRQLFELALRRYYERETVRLIEVLDGGGSPRARIRAALELVVRAALEDARRRGCLATNTAVEFGVVEETVNYLVRRTFERQEAAFKGAVLEAQAAGEVDRAADAGALARLLLAAINGIRVLAKADPAPERLDGLVEAAMRAL